MALQKAGLQLTADGANEFMRLMRGAEGAMSSFVSETVHAGTKVGAAGQSMIGAFREIGAMGVRALTDVGRKLTDLALDFGKLSLGGAMDLQDSMAMLGATSEATGGELDKLKKLARDLGADLTLPATSAADAGKAMFELSKAGLSVDQVMGAAKGTLQLAAAANISEAEAAEIASNALNVFKLSGDKATQVADLLAAAANKSSIDIKDAAASFKMAGSVFSAFQGPVVGSEKAMSDLTAAIALLGNAGIKGSDAGTSLKQMLLQLTGPSEKSKGVMQDLARSIGVTGDIAFTSEGKMRPLKEIIDLVTKSTKNMTEEQRAFAITQIFGADASRAVIALMQAGPQAFDDMSAAINRQGAAADLANARNAGLRGALDGLKSTIETIGLTLAEPFLEPLEEGARRLAQAIGKLPVAKWADRTAQALARFMKRIQTGTFSDLGPYLLKVGRDLGAAATQWAMDSLPTAMANLTYYRNKIIDTILAATPGIMDALGGWGRELVGWLSKAAPIMLANFTQSTVDLVTIIGNRLPAIIDALGKWGGAFINWVVTATPGLLAQIGIAVGKIATAVGNAVPGIATALAKWGHEIVVWVPVAVPKLIGELVKLYTGVAKWITDRAPDILSKFATWGATLSQWVTNASPGAMGRILEYRNQVVSFILTSAPTVLNTLGEWGKHLVGWISAAAPGMLSTFTAKTVDLINVIGGHLPAIITALGKWGLALVNWVVTSAPGMLRELGIAAGKLIDAIGANVPGIVTALAKWGAEFVAWVPVALPKLIGELVKLYGGLAQWIIDRVPNVATQIGKWAIEFYAWVGPATGKLIIAAGEMLGKLLLWIVQNQGPIGTKLLEWAAKFGLWITNDAIPAMLNALVGLGTTIFDWIAAKAVDIGKEGSVGRAIVDGIKNGVSSAWTGFLTWMDGIWTSFVTSVKTFFGIASPSTLMADQVGKPLIEGVRSGVEYYQSAISTFMTNFFRDYVFAPLTNMVSGAYDNARKIIEQLRAGFESYTNVIKEFTTSYFNTNVVGPIIGAIAATGVYDKARKIIEQIQAGFESMKSTISTYTSGYFSTNVVGPITSAGTGAYNAGKQVVEQVRAGIEYYAVALKDFATTFFTTNVFTPLKKAIGLDLASGLPTTELYQVGLRIVEQVRAGIEYYAGALKDFASTFFTNNLLNPIRDKLITPFWSGTEMISSGASIGKEFVQGIWKGISDFWQREVLDKLNTDFLYQLPQKIKSILLSPVWVGTDFISAAVDIGKNFVEGIYIGIRDFFKTKLLDRLQNEIYQLPQWIKDILGIHSPSRVAALEIGAPFAKGIGVGFMEEMARVQQMVSSSISGMAFPQMVQPVTTAAHVGAQAANVSNTYQRVYHYSPTYGATPPSPVQDFAVMRALAL